jgi:kinesin family protein 5
MRAKKIKNKPKINKEVTVAELKIEIDKLERLLIICNSRILQLEKFILKNNLVPPIEGDMSFLKDDQKLTKDEELNELKQARKNSKKMKSLALLEKENENDNGVDHIDDDDLLIDENARLDGLNNFDLHGDDADYCDRAKQNVEIVSNHDSDENNNNNENSNEENPEIGKLDAYNGEKLKEIADKYAHVMDRMNILEEDKKELSDKLEDAMSKISDLSNVIEIKEKAEEDLIAVKNTYNQTVAELNENIKKLEEKLELERNKIKSTTEEKADVKLDEKKSNSNNIKTELIEEETQTYDKNTDEFSNKMKEYLSASQNKSKSDLNKIMLSLYNLLKNKINNGEIYLNNEEDNNSNSLIFGNSYRNLDIENSSEFEIGLEKYHKESSSEGKSISVINEESMKKERRKHENEKKIILKARQEKTEKVYLRFIIILFT